MINAIRIPNKKLYKLKKFTDIKLYDNFKDLNDNYKKGPIIGALDWQSKYFVKPNIRENILNYNLVDFAKNKYRTYEVAKELGIKTLKTCVILNPAYETFRNSSDVDAMFSDDEIIVIKPNDGGGARDIYKTNKKSLEFDISKKMWNEYILCQEYIKGNYQDVRVVILEPVGVVDCFSRQPANVIEQKRDYENRVDIELTSEIQKYVEKIRKYIKDNFSSKYMFYSIDFYITDNGIVFGEINSNIGIQLVSGNCLKQLCEQVGKGVR